MSNVDFHVVQYNNEDKYVLVVRKDNKFFTTKSIYGIENLIEVLDTLPDKSCIRLYKISHKKS